MYDSKHGFHGSFKSWQLDGGLRICKKCGQEKSLNEFGKDKQCKDGHRYTCNQCRRDANRKIPIDRGDQRFCRKCLLWKNIEQFEKSKSCPSGYRRRCKLCKNALYIKKGYNLKSGFQKGHKGFRQTYPKGVHYSPATEFKKGRPAHNKIRDGVSEENDKIRCSKKYRNFRKTILERDGWKCTQCGEDNNHRLHIHHLKGISHYPELVYESSNVVTLCWECHAKTDDYGGKTSGD